MRGQIGYLYYEIERMKREGKLPPDYTPFPPFVTVLMLFFLLLTVCLLASLT